MEARHSESDASERQRGSQRSGASGEAASERRCRGVRGAKLVGSDEKLSPRWKRGIRRATRASVSEGASGAERAAKRRASDVVGESEGRSSSDQTRSYLLDGSAAFGERRERASAREPAERSERRSGERATLSGSPRGEARRIRREAIS